MTDNRFITPGVDERFKTQGVDARFPSPGTDTRFLADGTDTRFQGEGGGGPENPIKNTTPPTAVVKDQNTLTYGAGVWTGDPTIEAHTVVNSVQGSLIVPGDFAILPEWRGQWLTVVETAKNAEGVTAGTSTSVQVQVPAAAAFHPKDLFANGENGCCIVFALGSMFQNVENTIPVAAPGDPIMSVLDVSPNAKHAIAMALLNAPLYQVSNGKDVGRFDGVNHRMQNNAPLIVQTLPGKVDNLAARITGSEITHAVKAKANVSNAFYASARTGIGSFSVSNLGTTFESRSRGSIATAAVTTPVVDLSVEQSLICAAVMTTGVSIKRAGSAEAVTNNTQGAEGETWGNNVLEIMGRTNNSGFMNGDLRFVFVINRSLSPQERTDLEAWMVAL